ncbi:MAG: pitrilysin family protein, partial [Alphaproteobacteria bacterium]|nr:pitrilysin family protein [Alphaproteobacteria bacterium]
AGKVVHEALVVLVAKHFVSIAPGNRVQVAAAAYQGGDRRETRELEQLHSVVGFPGVAVSDPEFYVCAVLSNLLGGGMSSRLFQEIREKRALAYSVYSFTSAFRDCGLLGIYAGAGPERAAELLPALAGELTGLAATLREEEIDSSRAQLKASLLMGLESTGARCEQLAQQLLTFGRALSVEEIVDQVDAVDKPRLAALATEIFSGRPTLAVIGPESKLESYDNFATRFTA